MADLEVALIADQHQVEIDASPASLTGIRAGVDHIAVEIIVLERPLLLRCQDQRVLGSL
jgi:hypothetical protein